jgi:hypothetical protein
VQPELEEEDAVFGEHLLEPGDPFEFVAELRFGDFVEDAADDGAGVPGAEEDADAPYVVPFPSPNNVVKRSTNVRSR